MMFYKKNKKNKKKKSKLNVRKAFNYIFVNNKHFARGIDFLVDLTFIVTNFEYSVLKFEYFVLQKQSQEGFCKKRFF